MCVISRMPAATARSSTTNVDECRSTRGLTPSQTPAGPAHRGRARGTPRNPLPRWTARPAPTRSGAERPLGRHPQHLGRGDVVVHRRNARASTSARSRHRSARAARRSARGPAARRCPRTAGPSSAGCRAAGRPAGSRSAARPACATPHTSTAAARGSSRRVSTAGRPVITVPIAYTRSVVRCGREVCPPGPNSRSSMTSDVEVIAPGLQPDPAHLQPRVAVQREDGAQAVERPGGDDVVRPAGKDLLGRLEDQPHPAGERRPPWTAPAPRRAAPSGARRARRHARCPAASRSTAGRSPRGSAARRCPRAARPPFRRNRSRRPPRCRSAAARPRSRRRAGCAGSARWSPIPARPSSGWACTRRRSSTRPGQLGGEHAVQPQRAAPGAGIGDLGRVRTRRRWRTRPDAHRSRYSSSGCRPVVWTKLAEPEA